MTTSFDWLLTRETSYLHPFPHYYLLTVSLSFCFFAVLYFVSGWLLPGYAKLKKNCSPGELKDLKSRVVSNVHAVYAVAAAFYLFATDEKLRGMDLLYGSDEITLFYGVSMGYFIYDLLLILTDFSTLGGMGMLAHHFVAMAAQLSTSGYIQFHLVIVLFAITEITTPFVNNRVLLTKLEMKDSILFVLNGLAMCLGFIFFRMTLVPLGAYLMISQWSGHVSRAAPLIVFLAIAGQVVLGMLNTLWTYKIVSGLFKILFGSSNSKSNKATPANTAAKTTTSKRRLSVAGFQHKSD